MKEIYSEKDVDAWVCENGVCDATGLLNEMLPKHRAKLNRLDKRIRELLKEVQKVFPDARYYTASGGFNLILGDTHGIINNDAVPQSQRCAWGGLAQIGDGDW